MTLVRHILPRFGLLPGDLALHSMSGIVGVAYYLARQQVQDGWEAQLVGLAGANGCATSVKGSSHSVSRTVVHPWKWFNVLGYDFRYLAPLAVTLSVRRAADVHHVYSDPFHLALGRSVKRVLHFQTPISDVSPRFVRAVQRADAVICCSHFIRNQFESMVKYPEEKVYTVLNGVDLKRFMPGDKTSARARLGIPNEQTVLLYAGQVNEEKGLLYLVRACRILALEYDIQLVVAGSSKLWGDVQTRAGCTSYEDQVAEEALKLRTTFLGRVPHADMPLVYQAADVFICPSVWEDPFPLTNLEAMASGLPVVGTDSGGIPEAIHDGETGFVVPAADAEALARVLRRLLADLSLRRRMEENSVRRAREFGWEAIAGKVQSIYQEIGASGG